MKKLKGKITISKIRCFDENNFISIKIHDVKSSCEAIEAKLTLENFAQAITGHGYIDCDLEFNDSGVIGKIRETKHELIPRITFASPSDYYIKDYIKELEIDGWKARKEDITNPHNWVDDDKVKVLFVRYVENKIGADDGNN